MRQQWMRRVLGPWHVQHRYGRVRVRGAVVGGELLTARLRASGLWRARQVRAYRDRLACDGFARPLRVRVRARLDGRRLLVARVHRRLRRHGLVPRRLLLVLSRQPED